MGFAGAIVDLDGTVYRSSDLLPGADGGVDALRAAGLDLCFLSNNPTHSGEGYVERLREMGVDARDGEARSAADVTVSYLERHHAGDAVLVVGSDRLVSLLESADVDLTPDPATADVLLASWTPEFHYDDLEVALRTLADDETVFLGTDPDRTWPTADGGEMPGSGAIIRAIAGVTDREPDLILGKPSEHARTAALDCLGVPAEECLIVGDRLETDLAMGERAGMTTVLVLSGVTDRADLAAASIRPDHVIDDLGAIRDVLASP